MSESELVSNREQDDQIHTQTHNALTCDAAGLAAIRASGREAGASTRSHVVPSGCVGSKPVRV
jgi:hypothetical protein